MKLRKFLAKLFVVAATFFVVLSPIVLVEEAGHNCTHEDCQFVKSFVPLKKTLNTPLSSPLVRQSAY